MSDSPAIATTSCYCGGVRMELDVSEQPPIASYCHCDSCRKAHAAPMYQCVYVDPSKMKILAGEELIKEYRKEGAPLIRAFCTECGSRVYNKHDVVGLGVFPGMFTPKLPESYDAKLHYREMEAVFPLEKLTDGLQRVNDKSEIKR
eukprot:TRINITY_DN10925_c0_g2_i2.p2 TRINITY_DN10925_c0_g2~~TRINITY_DN10925_c0_g2_i2.p2  ORF type:complete len:146 (+),score=47.60 TRINITY_DN10925_c0_g2_i2:53-490(+)